MLLYPETKAATAREIFKQQSVANKNLQNSNSHLKFSIASLLNNNLQNGKPNDYLINDSSYEHSNDNSCIDLSCFNYDSSIKNWLNWYNYQRQSGNSKYELILNMNKNRSNMTNHQNNTFQFNQQPIMNTSVPQLNNKQKTNLNQNQSLANQFNNYTSTLSNSAGGKISSTISNKKKRARTIFSNDQLQVLELEFERTQYMVGHERVNLAAKLSLSEAQVKVWFQNRRIKFRKFDLDKKNNNLNS